MSIDRYLQQALAEAAAQAAPGAQLSRRSFVTMSVGGTLGLALLPLAACNLRAQQASLPPGQKPTGQPTAFIIIAKDGTTTVRCNRVDTRQGIETALAMVCAGELEADWSKSGPALATSAATMLTR